MFKQTVKRGIIGSFIGMAAGIIIPCAVNIVQNDSGPVLSQKVLEMCGDEAHAMLLTLLLTGIMGFLDCAGMTFYEIEQWSLLRVMATHLGVIFAAFLPTAHILGWVGSLEELIIISVIMLIGYFIVWRIMCVIYSKQAEELNRLQQEAMNKSEAAKDL